MPISGDELDQNPMHEPTSTMSKAEIRKTHKPIMEKRRRARINQCLGEIKTLILEAMKKDPARHSKLEKADILEMAVKHLQNVQRQQLALAMAGDPAVLRKFKTGFNECAREISTYVTQVDEQNCGLRNRITDHLGKCMNGIEQIARFNFPGVNASSFLSNGIGIYSASNTRSEPIRSDDLNNNPRIQPSSQGIQLIPSRLPTGELAFFLPNSSNLSDFPALNDNETGRRCSAFATVIRSTTKPLSPPPSPDNHQDDDLPIANENSRRSPSPRGFRPLNRSLQKSYCSAFLSTAKLGRNVDLEADNTPTQSNMRNHPVDSSTDKKVTTEPLCIITNQSERFKQAQVLYDTVECEENRRGVKRKLELHAETGKVPVGPSRDYFRHQKEANFCKESNSDEHKRFKCSNVESTTSEREREEVDNVPSTSQKNVDNVESNNDMWRPW